MTNLSRPLGVTLLAILHILQAVVFFLGGVALIALGAFMRRGLFRMPHFLNGIVSLIGVVIVIVGLLYLGLAWGLWTGKGWAWIASLILAILGIIISVLSLVGGRIGALLILILDAIIVYYLYTPNVRAYFGEYKPSQIPPPTQAVPTSPQPTGESRYCSNCAAPLQPQDKFCMHCGKPVP